MPKENNTPSATKWTQNEPKTIIHRHDDVWRTTVCDEQLSVLSDDSLRRWRRSRPAQPIRNRNDDDEDILDIDDAGGAGGEETSMLVSADIALLR